MFSVNTHYSLYSISYRDKAVAKIVNMGDGEITVYSTVLRWKSLRQSASGIFSASAYWFLAVTQAKLNQWPCFFFFDLEGKWTDLKHFLKKNLVSTGCRYLHRFLKWDIDLMRLEAYSTAAAFTENSAVFPGSIWFKKSLTFTGLLTSRSKKLL